MCATTSQRPEKACSGKCSGGPCSASRTYFAAACDGMAILFEMTAGGNLQPVLQADGVVMFSLDEFSNGIAAGIGHADRLVLVGSRTDIIWAHSALPVAAARQVSAEIHFKLMEEWFRQPELLHRLTSAIKLVCAQPH